MHDSAKLFGKLKMFAALTLVFVLVFATNLVDNNSFKIVKNSVLNIYQDRLVASDLLYKINQKLLDKKIIYLQSDNKAFEKRNQSINDSMQTFLDMYAETKLTTREAKVFASLRKDLDNLKAAEENYNIHDKEFAGTEEPIEVQRQFNIMRQDLDQLASIQLEEGRRQLAFSLRAIGGSEMISKLEIGFLVFLGIIVQILIFYNPKRTQEEEESY